MSLEQKKLGGDADAVTTECNEDYEKCLTCKYGNPQASMLLAQLFNKRELSKYTKGREVPYLCGLNKNDSVDRSK